MFADICEANMQHGNHTYTMSRGGLHVIFMELIEPIVYNSCPMRSYKYVRLEVWHML